MPRRPGASTHKEEDLAKIPEFVDPDESTVSSWFADYKPSEGNREGDAAWLAAVASGPQRSARLGVGATPKEREPKEMQPLSKAARKAMNRRLQREKEEEEQASEGRKRLEKWGLGGIAMAPSESSEEEQGRAGFTRQVGATSAPKGDALSVLLAKASETQAAQDEAAARKKARRKRNRQKAGLEEKESKPT